MQDGHGGPGASNSRSNPDAWVFDVDGCLIDSLTGTSLRPGAMELLAYLGNSNRVLLWSAGGGDYARRRAEQFSVERYVSACFSKEERDGDGHYRTDHLSLDPDHAVFVDDRPEDLAVGLYVVAVSPYIAPDAHDRGLAWVARRAGLGLKEVESMASDK